MSGSEASYAADLDLMAETVSTLQRCQRACDEALDAVTRHVGHLHRTWRGDAAEEQARAHEQWEAGFATMREGLVTMHSAADTAGGNYRAAVEANLTMWEAL